MWLFKKKSKRGINFTDVERQASAETRRLNGEIKRQKQRLELERLRLEAEREKLQLQQEIEELKEELEPEEEEEETGEEFNLNKMLSVVAMQMLQKSNNVGGIMSSPESMQTFARPQITLSDEAIDQAVARIPKPYLKAVKHIKQEDLKQIFEYVKTCDDDTINRFIQKAKNI